MATIFQVPARNDLPWYTFQITISGVIYVLVFRYNSRMQRWIMDIRDPQNNQILSGVPILIGLDLTGQYIYLNIPPGIFMALDNTHKDLQPTIYAFGITNTFYYEDPN